MLWRSGFYASHAIPGTLSIMTVKDHDMMVLLPRRDQASVLLHPLVRQSRPLCVSTHCSEHRLLLGVATGTRGKSSEGEHAISASESSESGSSSSSRPHLLFDSPMPSRRWANPWLKVVCVVLFVVVDVQRGSQRARRGGPCPETLAEPSTGCDQSFHRRGVSSHGSGWSPT